MNCTFFELTECPAIYLLVLFFELSPDPEAVFCNQLGCSSSVNGRERKLTENFAPVIFEMKYEALSALSGKVKGPNRLFVDLLADLNGSEPVAEAIFA